MRLEKGKVYDREKIYFVEFFDAENKPLYVHDGMYVDDWFGPNGEYLGPDCDGVEPDFEYY